MATTAVYLFPPDQKPGVGCEGREDGHFVRPRIPQRLQHGHVVRLALRLLEDLAGDQADHRVGGEHQRGLIDICPRDLGGIDRLALPRRGLQHIFPRRVVRFIQVLGEGGGDALDVREVQLRGVLVGVIGVLGRLGWTDELQELLATR